MPLSAPAPVAVLSLPSVLLKRAPSPTAVLNRPIVLLKSAGPERPPPPTATLWSPLVLLKRTLSPIAVLKDPVSLYTSASGSNGRVVTAGCVEQQRCSANCGIGISGVEEQRSSANTGVEVVGTTEKERIPTNSCVSRAGCEESEGVAPFRRREPGIAPVRRRDNLRSCLHLWQKPKEEEREYNKGRLNSGIHMREISEKVRHLVEINLVASSGSQTLARCNPRTSSQWFHKITWNALFVVGDGTGRVGERCFLW
jgi:hypothetical protein